MKTMYDLSEVGLASVVDCGSESLTVVLSERPSVDALML